MASEHRVSSDPPGGGRMLPAEAGAVLQRLWGRSVARFAGTVPRTEVLTAAVQVSQAAREAGLRPEQLIREVKDSWHAYRGFGDAEHRNSAEVLLGELISLCIAEFYSQRSSRSVDRPPAVEERGQARGVAEPRSPAGGDAAPTFGTPP